MTKLAQPQHPDTMHLEAAAGWIQLGDYDSANDELEKIRAEWRAHPDVLDLWVRVPPGVPSKHFIGNRPPSFSGSWRR